jgi:hypothetical protein
MRNGGVVCAGFAVCEGEVIHSIAESMNDVCRCSSVSACEALADRRLTKNVSLLNTRIKLKMVNFLFSIVIYRILKEIFTNYRFFYCLRLRRNCRRDSVHLFTCLSLSLSSHARIQYTGKHASRLRVSVSFTPARASNLYSSLAHCAMAMSLHF